jgi:hypothetical protein
MILNGYIVEKMKRIYLRLYKKEQMMVDLVDFFHPAHTVT